MQDVNIYIETSNKGPVRRDGEYIYVLECLRDGEPVTRDGRGQLKNTNGKPAYTAGPSGSAVQAPVVPVN